MKGALHLDDVKIISSFYTFYVATKCAIKTTSNAQAFATISNNEWQSRMRDQMQLIFHRFSITCEWHSIKTTSTSLAVALSLCVCLEIGARNGTNENVQ